jgi:hypothetical protein
MLTVLVPLSGRAIPLPDGSLLTSVSPSLTILAVPRCSVPMFAFSVMAYGVDL